MVAAFMALPGFVEAKPGCKTKACHERVLIKHMRRVTAPYWRTFERLAYCESTSNWTIRNPPYAGGIQFKQGSWESVGGRGSPAQASKLEQIYRGVLLMRSQGWGAWPVCRRAAGV